MIEAVIFDLDNTLVDFSLLKKQAVMGGVKAMLEAGLRADADTVYRRIFEIYEEKGWEYQTVFDDVIMEFHGCSSHKFLAAAIIGYKKSREAALNPYPGVYATLIALMKKGLKLAVVSDAPGREAWLRLYQLNFHHLFDVVVTHSDSGEFKPSPKPFKLALDHLGSRPEACVMVGDWAERDMIGAKNLGMVTVFARYGDIFNTRDHGADYEIARVDEILDIVAQLNGDPV
jgi:putative hydrolase of the HAD superfamily